MSQITTNTNNDSFQSTSDTNGNIVKFGNEPYTYIFNNTNEYVIFQMTVNGGHLCFLYNEDNTQDIQTPAVLKSKYTIHWKKKSDNDWSSDNTLDYPLASKIFDITGSVLSFLMQKNELLQSLSAGVTANEIIDYTEYDFKIVFEDITGNNYDTFDSINAEKNNCLVIDNKPVEITSGTFYAEPATGACQDDVPAWKKYAMVGDTITLTINTNGKINTILNKNNYATNFTNGTNKLQGDTVLTYPTNTNSCDSPYKTDNSTNSTYVISYLFTSTSSDGNTIQFNISYKDCSGNEKSYSFDQANEVQGSDFGQITVDTTPPTYTPSAVSDNCYSSTKVKSQDKIALTISPDEEIIRTNLAHNCKFGVDFYLKAPPMDSAVNLTDISYNTVSSSPQQQDDDIVVTLTIPDLPTVGPAGTINDGAIIYYKVTVFDLAGNQGDNGEKILKNSSGNNFVIDDDPPEISTFSCKGKNAAGTDITFPNTTDTSVTPNVTTYYVKGGELIKFDLTSDENLVNSNSIPSPTPQACNSTTLNPAVEVSEFKINTDINNSTNVVLQTPFARPDDSDATNWISTWTVPTSENGDLTMKLKLTDEAGNQSVDIDPFSYDEKCNIVIDNTKPTFNSYTVTTNGNANYDSTGTTVETYFAIVDKTITFDFIAKEYISEPTVKFLTKNNTLIPNGNSGNCKLDDDDKPEPGYLCTVNPNCQDIGLPSDCDSSIDVSNPVATANQAVYYKLWRATYKIDSNWNSINNDGRLKIEISDFYDIAGNLGETVSFTTGDSGIGDLATAIIDIDTVKPELSSFTLDSNGNTIGTSPNVTQYYAKVGDTITFKFNTSEPVLKPTIKLYTTNSDSNMFDFTVSESTDNGVTCVTVYGEEDDGTVPETKYCDKWVATYTIPNDWDSDNDDGNIIIKVSNYKDEHGNSGETLTFSDTIPPADDSTQITVPITIDTTLPSAFDITTESTATGVADAVITSGYYNATNTGIKITIPVDNDTSLVGGSIQIQTKNDEAGSSYDDWGTAISITDTTEPPSVNTSYVYTSSNFANAPGYSNDKTISFKVIITDVAGNSTASNEPTLIVDRTLPTLQAPENGEVDKITSATYNDANIWNINSGYLNIVENSNAQTLSFQCNDNHLFSDSTLLRVWFQNTDDSTPTNLLYYPPNSGNVRQYYQASISSTDSSTITGNVLLSLENGTILPNTDDYKGKNFKLHATVSDKAGNVKDIASGVFQANFTAPEVVSFTLSNTTLSISNPKADVTLKFNVVVQNFDSDNDITTGNNVTLSRMTTTDNKEWTGELEAKNNEEYSNNNILQLQSGTYSDLANNPGPAAQTLPFIVDTQKPIINAIETSAFSWGAVLNSIEDNSSGTVSVTTSGVENGQILTITLNGQEYTNTVNNNQTVVTIPAAGLQGLTESNNPYTMTADVADLVGNSADQVTSSSFTVDTTLPTISSTTDFTNQNLCTVTFSEEVLDANGNSLTIANFTTAIDTGYAPTAPNYTPTFTVAAQNPFTSDNKTFNFIITITNGSYIFGSEEIVFTPSGVYDEAGNEASSTQTNNRSALTNITTSATASDVTIASNNNF